MEEANRREQSQGDNRNNGKIKSQVQKEEDQVKKKQFVRQTEKRFSILRLFGEKVVPLHPNKNTFF